MRDFKKLKVWQKAYALTLDVYQATSAFPKQELYGLTSQLRRASVSVGSNLTEGCGRLGQREMARFLQLSIGSANEMEYQLLLSRDLGFLQKGLHQELDSRVQEVRRMLTALLIKVNREYHFEVR